MNRYCMVYGLIAAALLGLTAGCGQPPAAEKPAARPPLPQPSDIKRIGEPSPPQVNPNGE